MGNAVDDSVEKKRGGRRRGDALARRVVVFSLILYNTLDAAKIQGGRGDFLRVSFVLFVIFFQRREGNGGWGINDEDVLFRRASKGARRRRRIVFFRVKKEKKRGAGASKIGRPAL